MIYRVVVLPYAVQDLENSHAWAEQHAPETADAWLNRISEAIESLAANPTRCPLAKENRKGDMEIRELHFGRRAGAYRIIFTIEPQKVRVLRVLRAQRRGLSRREIEQADDS